MQPHSGAVATVINYLLPTIKLAPDKFKGKSIYVRTSSYDSRGKFSREKYHLIKTIRLNPEGRLLTFEVGKDYACYMEVRYDGSYEWFDCIKHRHTHVREKFRYFQGSTTIDGEYISEAGFYHRLEGRVLNLKRVEFYDSFIDPIISKHNKQRWKYEFEILSVHS